MFTNLFDVQDNRPAADLRRDRNGDEACAACGRKVELATAWVIMAAEDGTLFPLRTEAEVAHADQHAERAYALGSECARLVPATHRTR